MKRLNFLLYRISQIETESQQSIYFGANIDHRLHGWVKGFGFFWSWISRMGFDHGLHGCVKGFDFLFALDFTEEGIRFLFVLETQINLSFHRILKQVDFPHLMFFTLNSNSFSSPSRWTMIFRRSPALCMAAL